MRHIQKYDNFINEASMESKDDASEALSLALQLDAEAMEIFLKGLSEYFKDSVEELNNMNAEEISKHLAEAHKLVKERTGN